MIHTIQPGDTLSKIAKANGISLDELLEANPTFKPHPDLIHVGDGLVIPGSDEPDPEEAKPDNIEPSEAEPDADEAPAQPAAGGHVLGALSAKFEVGGRGPGTVSTGRGDAGGVSYGSYQMTSVGNGGTVERFVRQANFRWKNDFAGLTPGSAAFTKVWKTIATTAANDFQAAQHGFIKKTHFDPLLAKVKAEDGLDLSARSHALQDVAWSTAVQHGPGSSIIHKAIATLHAVDANAPDFDSRLIKAIYAERGRKDANGVLVHFSKNSKNVQKGVAERFVNEQKDALKMLAEE